MDNGYKNTYMKLTACLSNGLTDLNSIPKSLPLKIRIILWCPLKNIFHSKIKKSNSFLIGGLVKCTTAFDRA
jgi:hypothetical protein